MCIINLSDILSQSDNMPTAGSLFYKKIVEAFDASQNVTVNMADVSSLPSIFLNVSIGRIIDEYGISKLKQGVSFTMITKAQALRLKEYLAKFQS